MRNKRKPYRIIGAYDSETSNCQKGLQKFAFPILHQLGIIDCPIEEVHSSDVERHTEISLYRHTFELTRRLDDIAEAEYPYVPVICCHNLSFDMWGLSSWLSGHDVRVLAKSAQKPITFTILDDQEQPRLVIWDTLVFSGHGLAYMGDACGYPKLRGDWDYSKVRTPETLLTNDEIRYAAHDVYALLAWLGYWCRLNPDIEPSSLGQRVVTKTGVVRARRLNRFSRLQGDDCTANVGKYWMQVNQANAFDTDDELFACNAATRGGFTFCSSVNASVPFDIPDNAPERIYGFDATSQHPSQMVSHFYPQDFHCADGELLDIAFDIVRCKTLNQVLDHYDKPFPVAFYARFDFENLRIKEGSCFEKWGVASLAWARCKEYRIDETIAEDNQQGEQFRDYLGKIGYKDAVSGAFKHSFGKLESAEHASLWLTELAAWELCQIYDFDSVKAHDGYLTGNFYRPTDMSVISVMQFYAGKNAFKKARSAYYKNQPIPNIEELRHYGIPDFVIDGMIAHEIEDSTVESTYLGLKSDLNALFGIEACNEYRRDTVLTQDGIAYEGEQGVCNMPKKPKAFYQFGQRIVGWSRVAQVIVMMLCAPHVDTVINGDTDSVKFLISDGELGNVTRALSRMDKSIDKAKHLVCSRVKARYPDMYDSLDGIGHYVLEFSTKRFCAAWNKAYCMEENGRLKFTLAGVPTGHGIEKMANDMWRDGHDYRYICNTFLGYNVTYSPDITGLVARAFPKWGDVVYERVTDYRGRTARVREPAALCLYDMPKTLGDTGSNDNRVNMQIAAHNNPDVNTEPVMIGLYGVTDLEDEIESIL